MRAAASPGDAAAVAAAAADACTIGTGKGRIVRPPGFIISALSTFTYQVSPRVLAASASWWRRLSVDR